MSNKHHNQALDKNLIKKSSNKSTETIVTEQDSTRICLQPSVTDYQTFIKTTYKAMGMTGKKPSREKVKRSVQLLLS